MQREISNDLVFQLAYVASHGHDLPSLVDITQVSGETGSRKKRPAVPSVPAVWQYPREHE